MQTFPATNTVFGIYGVKACNLCRQRKGKGGPESRSVREVRSFLGFCTYYRRFVPGFSNIAKPQHQLSEKNAKFLWTEECNTAFRFLKQHLTKTPTLVYPDFKKPFILDTDASNVAIGALLSQVADGVDSVLLPTSVKR